MEYFLPQFFEIFIYMLTQFNNNYCSQLLYGSAETSTLTLYHKPIRFIRNLICENQQLRDTKTLYNYELK